METLFIVLAVVVAPLLIIFHYITKWKEMKSFTPEDEASIGDTRSVADRLENRIRTLERILDEDVPNWRRRDDDL